MIAAILILTLFLSCCAAMLCDVDRAIEDAELDDLWEDDEPSSWSAEV